MIQSKDDLSLTARAPTQDERRTRSSSPVKNRKVLPSDFYDEDNDIWSINSNSFTDKVKSLSSSPIANKLHISPSPGRSKYVIPIPFQLKLPPKLSSASQSLDSSSFPSPVATPNASRNSSPSRSVSPKQKQKQVRLVYTGSGYEKLESSEEEDNSYLDDEELLQQKIKMSSRPNLGFVKRHAADELSVINEGSETSSRNSTIRGKGKLFGANSIAEKSQPFPASPAASLRHQQSSLGSPATIKSSPESEVVNNPHDSLDHGSQYLRERFHYQQANVHADSYNVPRSAGQLYTQPLYGKSIASRSISESLVSSLETNSTSARYFGDHERREVLMASTNEKGMQGRMERLRNLSSDSSCSQRSAVSSVSRSSYDSIQGSVNLTLREESMIKENDKDPIEQDFDAPVFLGTRRGESVRSSRSTSTLELRLHSSENSDDSSSSSDLNDLPLEADLVKLKSLPLVEATLPLRVSRGALQKDPVSPGLDDLSNLDPPSITEFAPPSPGNSVMDDLESVINGYYDTTNADSEPGNEHESDPEPEELDASKVSDGSFNDGAGKRFSFPNTMDNITNTEIARERARSSRASLASTRRSFVDKEGQIEIPDLDYLALQQKRKSYDFNSEYDYGSQYTGSSHPITKSATCSVLEPLGVPSKEARDFAKSQFIALFPGEDSDTDIDDIKSVRASKSTPCLNVTSELVVAKDQIPQIQIASSEVPQEEVQQVEVSASQPPSRRPRHARHKSMFNFDFNIKDLTLKLTKSRSLPDIPNDKVLLGENEPTVPSISKLGDKSEANTASDEAQIVVAEPPAPVEYAVDFKDNQNVKSVPDDVTFHRNYNYMDINRTLSKLNQSSVGKPLPDSHESGSNVSSYQSSRSFKSNSTTGTLALETESVIIDLTEDRFDICTVQRKDTTTSYRSVREKTKDGREIDVVLVEEEEDDRDLASLYSRYRNCWVSRSNSTTSSASNFSSVASFESGSSSRLVVKPSVNSQKLPTRRNILLNAGIPNSKSTNSVRRYQSARIQPPKLTSTNSLAVPRPPPKLIKRMDELAQKRNRYLAVRNEAKNLEKSLPPSPSSTMSSLQNNFDYDSRYSFHSFMEQNKIA